MEVSINKDGRRDWPQLKTKKIEGKIYIKVGKPTPFNIALGETLDKIEDLNLGINIG